MKLNAAILISIILHLSLIAFAILVPKTSFQQGNVYYVDLVQMVGGTGDPGGGGKGRKGQAKPAATLQTEKKEAVSVSKTSVRDLTVKKEAKSSLRYPTDSKKKPIAKTKKKEPEEKNLISVTRKQPAESKAAKTESGEQTSQADDNELSLGLSGSGSGGGTGGGTGTGSGSGSGPGGGWGVTSPYGYYYSTIRDKISASWYDSLVDPGLRGRYLVTTFFQINRDGSISDLKVELSSQVRTLDLSALRAIENAAPFPPIPSDFPAEYIIVHFEFEWEK